MGYDDLSDEGTLTITSENCTAKYFGAVNATVASEDCYIFDFSLEKMGDQECDSGLTFIVACQIPHFNLQDGGKIVLCKISCTYFLFSACVPELTSTDFTNFLLSEETLISSILSTSAASNTLNTSEMNNSSSTQPTSLVTNTFVCTPPTATTNNSDVTYIWYQGDVPYQQAVDICLYCQGAALPVFRDASDVLEFQ